MHQTRLKNIFFFLFTLIAVFFSQPLEALEKPIIGVAANFILPFKDMARAFEQKTSIRLNPIFTSTGNLYAQIRNGAPYDLFLAADQIRPSLLFKDGLAEKPFIYAQGKVVLWSGKKALCSAANTWQQAVLSAMAGRIGSANPETAPYGAAGMEALKQEKLWKVIEARLVYGQSVAQAFQYAHSRAVDASFCAFSSALSSKGREGCYFMIPEAPDVIQAACVLRRGESKPAVRKFAKFLRSAEAATIKKKHGYR
ncbi:molybdate ABC transporter substrate-binding protein [Thermodesulfobacteriota bacterium]